MNREGVAHLEVRPRREPDTGLFLSDSLGDGSSNLQGETSSVLKGSTVGVGSLVGDRLEELIGEITVGVVCWRKRR